MFDEYIIIQILGKSFTVTAHQLYPLEYLQNL